MLVAGLIAALFYLPLVDRPASIVRSAIKTLPLLAFSVAALLAGVPGVLVAGLALSALGDLALSRHGDKAFLAGLVSFALAHLCYLAVFVGLGPVPRFALPAAAVLIALAVSTEFWLSPHTGPLRWPVRAYVLIIVAMTVAAIGLWPQRPAAAAGAVLFLLSDLILAIRLFRLNSQGRPARIASLTLWVFYITGQALIAWAFM